MHVQRGVWFGEGCENTKHAYWIEITADICELAGFTCLQNRSWRNSSCTSVQFGF